MMKLMQISLKFIKTFLNKTKFLLLKGNDYYREDGVGEIKKTNSFSTCSWKTKSWNC